MSALDTETPKVNLNSMKFRFGITDIDKLFIKFSETLDNSADDWFTSDRSATNQVKIKFFYWLHKLSDLEVINIVTS